MMKTLLVFLTLFCLLGGSRNADAGLLSGRAGYGPVTMSADDTYYPSASGFDASHFDGNMTVYVWWKGDGPGTGTFQVQVSGFTAGEDPSNLSFGSATDSDLPMDTNKPYSIVGPTKRIRFYTTACTADCTTSVKVEGRVAP